MQTKIIFKGHTYISDFNSLEMISASDVNAQMKKSAITDVGDFPLWNRALCH